MLFEVMIPTSILSQAGTEKLHVPDPSDKVVYTRYGRRTEDEYAARRSARKLCGRVVDVHSRRTVADYAGQVFQVLP
jgi:hypothetical protein